MHKLTNICFTFLLAFSMALALPGSDPCTWGPKHWCSEREIAEKCGSGAVSFCTEQQLGAFALNSNQDIAGSDECTWGPSHWCRDRKVAEKCGVLEYCQKRGFFVAEKVGEFDRL